MLKNAGFSLVEALVVISITVVLTGILVVHSKTSEKQIIFFREQSILISAILRAKAFSIETFQPELQPGLPTPSGANRVCGWGVYFDKAASQVILFSDLAPGGGSASCTNANTMYTPGLNEKFESITFDPSVIIDCVGVNPGAGQPCVPNFNQLNVTFVPPDPTIVFNPGTGGGEAVIVLKLNDPSQPRTSTIRISQAGQVGVN